MLTVARPSPTEPKMKFESLDVSCWLGLGYTTLIASGPSTRGISGSGGAVAGAAAVSFAGLGAVAGAALGPHAATRPIQTIGERNRDERRCMRQAKPRRWALGSARAPPCNAQGMAVVVSLTLILTSPIFAHHTVFPARRLTRDFMRFLRPGQRRGFAVLHRLR